MSWAGDRILAIARRQTGVNVLLTVAQSGC